MHSLAKSYSYFPKLNWTRVWEEKLFFPRIFSRHNRIRRPVWISSEIAKAILKQCNTNFSNLSFKMGHQTITVIDREKEVVTRFAIGPIGVNKISNNYNFLKNCRATSVPKVISTSSQKKMLFFSQESLVPGAPILTKYNPRAYMKLLPKIIKTARPIYKKSKRYSSHEVIKNILFKMKAVNLGHTKLYECCQKELNTSNAIELNLTQIHGDFNLGNILEDQNENFYFVDFENSEYFFSTYDFALLYAYTENFQIRNPNYEYFIRRFVNYLAIKSGKDTALLMIQAHQNDNHNIGVLVYIACLSKLMIDLKFNLAHDHAASIKLTSHIDQYA